MATVASTLRPEEIDAILAGTHANPFSLLGPHRQADGRWRVIAHVPGAEAVTLTAPDGGALAPMAPLRAGALFAADLASDPGPYRLSARQGTAAWTLDDPYRFGPVLGAQDEHFIAEGTHLRLWQVLGARPCTHEGASGVVFAVWAPAARRVSVVGDFNVWDGRRHVKCDKGAALQVSAEDIHTGSVRSGHHLQVRDP